MTYHWSNNMCDIVNANYVYEIPLPTDGLLFCLQIFVTVLLKPKERTAARLVITFFYLVPSAYAFTHTHTLTHRVYTKE